MELGEAKLQQVEASWQSFKQRGWAVHFIDLTSLYLRLKIGAGRAVKAHLVDSERAASYGFDEQQAPTPIKMKSVTLLNKQEKPFTKKIDRAFLACCFLRILSRINRIINRIHI